MTALVLRLQLLQWRRDPRLLTLLSVATMLVLGATIWATAGDLAQRDARSTAVHQAREQWEGRGAANPHQMAHFGDFAFRPTGPLARLDRGVQARLGKVVFIEGHRQGVPMHSDVARAGTVARFVRPDAAFMLQTIVPLLLIFLGAAGFARDRETGRLKLKLVQGVGARAVLRGHFVALWGLGLAFVCLVVTSSVVTSAVQGSATVESPARLLGFVVAHTVFMAFVAGAIVVATAWRRTVRAALLTLLAGWVVGTTLLPRATATVSTAAVPLPSQDAFQARMRESREAGADGHNPQDAEVARRRAAMMEEHGVDDVEALPLNFDGIAMQVDEEFGNQVWDEHYGELRRRLAQQVSIASLATLGNPFQAIDHVSMSLSGTDLAHDLAFQEQAEAFRRELIARLNHEHAYGGSKTGEWSWKAPPEFFAGLDTFEYRAPGVAEALGGRTVELLTLALWVLLLLWAQRRAADRLERGTLPC
ncbi:MAG: DUF3526 domain-containing protein [Myxococcota bacterium]